MQFKKNIATSESGFVFNPANGESFSANPIGIEIINLLKEGKTQQEIIKVIVEKYNVESAQFEKDLYDYIFLLQQYQLIDAEK